MVTRPRRVPERGDAIRIDFNPQADREQAGRRPAVVLSPAAYNGRVGLALLCPITSQIKGYPFEVAIPEGPGALPNHMAVESVRSGSRLRSRNESMAHAMVVARLMEKRGRGWPLMRRAMREFNGTEPEIVNDENQKFVRVTFRFA